jgi:hypothetical protein
MYAKMVKIFKHVSETKQNGFPQPLDMTSLTAAYLGNSTTGRSSICPRSPCSSIALSRLQRPLSDLLHSIYVPSGLQSLQETYPSLRKLYAIMVSSSNILDQTPDVIAKWPKANYDNPDQLTWLPIYSCIWFGAATIMMAMRF